MPTEMEWMWAAMGATSDRSNGYGGTGTNTTGYTKGYAGSIEVAGVQANVGLYAWYGYFRAGSANAQRTDAVGNGRNANELGLYDMSGKVCEWCWDWSASYPGGAQSDYKGAVGGSNRVIRGGSINNSADNVTVAYRNNNHPNNRNNNIGFRVVRP